MLIVIVIFSIENNKNNIIIIENIAIIWTLSEQY